MEHGLPDAAADKLAPQARYGARTVLMGVAVALAGIPFGLLTHQVTREGPLVRFDTSAAERIHEVVRGNRPLTWFMETLSLMGKPIFLFFVIAIPCLWLARNGARKLTIFLIVTSIGGGLVDTVVKIAVARPRPVFDDPIVSAMGKSFPSGHAMSSLVCYGAVLVVLLPLIRVALRPWVIGATAALVLGIGVSRLALGVHFLSDVIGGYILGTAWLVGSVAVFEIWREERGKRHTTALTEGIEPEEALAAQESSQADSE